MYKFTVNKVMDLYENELSQNLFVRVFKTKKIWKLLTRSYLLDSKFKK